MSGRSIVGAYMDFKELSHDELPPLDTRALELDICHETRRTIVDLMRGNEPTTIIGVLVANRDGLTTREIAERLDRPVGEVSWKIEKLEGEDLCAQILSDTAMKVIPFAAYTERNE